MNTLFSEIIDAHGGMDRWNGFIRKTRLPNMRETCNMSDVGS